MRVELTEIMKWPATTVKMGNMSPEGYYEDLFGGGE
jgi:hypothetical protein